MLSIAIAVSTLTAMAQSGDENTIYFEDATVARGQHAVLSLMLDNVAEITGFQFALQLPEGITIETNDKGNYMASFNTATNRTDASAHTLGVQLQADGTVQVLCYAVGKTAIAGNSGAVIDFPIFISDEVEPDNYDVMITKAVLTTVDKIQYKPSATTSKIRVQRAQLPSMLPEGYAVEIMPQKVERGETMLKAYVKAATGIKSLKFDVELPSGMYFVDEAEWDAANVGYAYSSAAFTGDPSTKTATLASGDFPNRMSFNVEGTYTNKSKKYITATDDLRELVEFGPLYIATVEDEEENDWASNGTVMPAQGNNTVKVTNISMTDVNGNTVSGKEYFASFVYGDVQDANPIFYGDYSSEEAMTQLEELLAEDTKSVDLTSAMLTKKPTLANPNAIVYVSSDITGDNVVVDGACVNLVIADGQDMNVPAAFVAAQASYTREMTTSWGTIVLPYEVQSDEDVAYYLPSVIEEGVLRLTLQPTLPANTPAIVAKQNGGNMTSRASGVKVVTKNNKAVSGNVIMHGSYANNTKVDDTNAYFIYNDKFWQCNGHFFVDAFRAYFTVDGTAYAKSLSISADNIPTTLSALTGEGDVKVEAYYGMDGKQQDGLRNGMNIVKLSNGRSQKILIQ